VLPVNAYTIRPAADTDADALAWLARLDGQRPLQGPILVAQDGDAIVAAMSLDDHRGIADPFRESARALALLRSRAEVLEAVERTPLLRDRVRVAIRINGARWAESG
jgi:hypothetical protein